MDLSNSVVLPRGDFIELQEAAWNHLPPSFKDRMATTAQTTLMCLGVSAAVTVGTWGWASALDWRDRRSAERRLGKVTVLKDPAK